MLKLARHWADTIFSQLFNYMESRYSYRDHRSNYPKYNYFNDILCDLRTIEKFIEDAWKSTDSPDFEFTWECHRDQTVFNSDWQGGGRWRGVLCDC